MIKMRNYDKVAIQVPKILLPRNSINLQKWAVIACDQYTSQPEYWNAVKKFVGNSPSALNIIFPEVYLEDNYKLERIKNIHKEISKYIESNVFDAHEGFVYVDERVRGLYNIFEEVVQERTLAVPPSELYQKSHRDDPRDSGHFYEHMASNING